MKPKTAVPAVDNCVRTFSDRRKSFETILKEDYRDYRLQLETSGRFLGDIGERLLRLYYETHQALEVAVRLAFRSHTNKPATADDFIADVLRLEIHRAAALEVKGRPELVALWPVEPGIQFWGKAGFSTLDVAHKFIDLVYDEVCAARLSAIGDTCLGSLVAAPEPDARFDQWQTSLNQGLLERTLPKLPGEIHCDRESLVAKLAATHEGAQKAAAKVAHVEEQVTAEAAAQSILARIDRLRAEWPDRDAIPPGDWADRTNPAQAVIDALWAAMVGVKGIRLPACPELPPLTFAGLVLDECDLPAAWRAYHAALTLAAARCAEVADKTDKAPERMGRPKPTTEQSDPRTVAGYTDLMTTEDLSQLAGVKSSTFRNALSAARQAGTVLPKPGVKGKGKGQMDSYSYASIRPFLLSTWPHKAVRFPESFDDVKRILAADNPA